MEEHQSSNGSSGVAALYEDVVDEDEARLIIDEGCLPSEDNHDKFKGEQVPKLLKLKSRKDVPDTGNIYPCPDCGKMFRRKVKLQAHLLTHKSKEELECENCGKKFRKVDALFDHVCSGFGNNYKCPDCDEWFRLKKDLAVHQLSHKNTSTSDGTLEEKDMSEESDGSNFSSFVSSFVKWPIACIHCGLVLVNLENYNIHMATHKEGKPCACSMCKMKFSCRDDYLLHKVFCHIEGIFECTCCSKRFYTEKKLSEHLESHGREGACCDICGASFVSRDKLVCHMKIHKTNIFVCGKCKKIFKCNSSFKNHKCMSENSEKKFYTFADIPDKKGNEKNLDSWSANEESENEDTDFSQIVIGSHSCKVCGNSFEQKGDLIMHLATHFQCKECKKYFKNRSELDMHTYLLADEKLYSCYLCETVVHGKKELEYHLSRHLASDDGPFDDLEWDDDTEVFQCVIPSLDAEPLQSTLMERSVLNVKINKVVPAGNDTLKCLSCGKLVLLHHSLTTYLEPNTSVTDLGEEYVYISRLGSPQNKPKQTEENYCICHYSLDDFTSLGEQSPSKSFTGYESQETPNMNNTCKISAHLEPHKASPESAESKSKSLLNEVIVDTSEVQLDASNSKDSNSNNPNDFETLKPEIEANFKVLLNSNNLANRELTSSPVSGVSDFVTKKDCKSRSDGSKSILPNAELEDKKEVYSPKRPGIKVIKLDSKTESLPPGANTKEFIVNTNQGNGNILSKPVKILISTGLFSGQSHNLGITSEILSGSDLKKSLSVIKNSGTKRPHPEINTVSQEKLILPSQTGKDVGKSLQEKIKQEKSLKKLPPPKLKDNRIELIAAHSNGNSSKASNSKILTFETKSIRVKGEKRKNENQQEFNPSYAVEMMEGNHVVNPKGVGKTEPLMFRVKDKKPRPPKRSPFMKREQGKHKISLDASTPNTNGSEMCHIPESNMIFKVEQLRYDSDEDDEEESLDFSGIKKEFLASDVFIKEEEWDIVDF